MKLKLKLYKPRDIQDAVDAYNAQKKKKPCIFDLSGTRTVTAQRIADFVEGLAYARDGKVTRLSETMIVVIFRDAKTKHRSR